MGPGLHEWVQDSQGENMEQLGKTWKDLVLLLLKEENDEKLSSYCLGVASSHRLCCRLWPGRNEQIVLKWTINLYDKHAIAQEE